MFSTDRSGVVEIADEFGAPPTGCACITGEEEDLWLEDPTNPALDSIYEEILIDARQRCMEMAVGLDADVTPCSSAVLAGASNVTSELFKECRYIGATIDENKDGDCPIPGGDEAEGDETDGETDEEGGGVLFPDLPQDKVP
ncbi:MAG: hypothetical protein HC927_02895 [Deltaproteobacteria bacterium]|nr:hypothetical protein [Deltaproteobacteria bacterium]